MNSIAWLAIGALFGTLISNILFFLQSGYGTLKIDHSDPEKDVYRLEINSLDSICKKKHITLRVDNFADLSQK